MTLEPTARVTNWRPLTEYVMGEVLMVACRGTRQRVLPLRSSAATK